MKTKYIDRIFYAIVGLVNGTLGSGGGTLLIPYLSKRHKIDGKEAHATTLAAILPLSVVSAAIYMKNVDFTDGIFYYTTAGTTIGAIIGALMLKKISTGLLKKIFGFVMLITSIRMFFI